MRTGDAGGWVMGLGCLIYALWMALWVALLGGAVVLVFRAVFA